MQRFMDLIGYCLCHQLSARTFTAGEWVYPICARDTGMYLAVLVTFIVLACLYKQHRAWRRPPTSVLVVLGVFIALLVLDGLTSYAGLRESNNLLRYVSGYLCGISLGVGLFWVFAMTFYATWTDERLLGVGRDGGSASTAGTRKTVLATVVVLAAGAALYLLRSSLGLFGPLLTTAAIIVTFAILAALIAGCIRPLMRRIPEGKRLVPFVFIGLGGAAVLLAGLGVIKSLIVG